MTWTSLIAERWNGSAWQPLVIEEWNGSAWAPAVAERFSATTSAANLTVGSPSAFSLWQAALARQGSGGGEARINVIGDSLVYGFGGAQPYEANSFTDRARTLLNTSGPLAGTVAEGMISLVDANSDTRIPTPPGWSWEAGFGLGLCGQNINSNGSANALSVTGTGTAIDVYYVAGQQSWTYTIDGGSPVTVPAGTLGNARLRVAGLSNASHTIAITASAGQTRLWGIEFHANLTTGIRMSRMGVGGTTAGSWASTASAFGVPNPSVTTFFNSPDLTVVFLGTNDINQAVGASTYAANLTTLIGNARAKNSDVLLVTAPQPGVVTNAQPYADAALALAIPQNVGVLDVYRRWPAAYADQSAWRSDSLHANSAGYWDIANAVADAIAAVS